MHVLHMVKGEKYTKDRLIYLFWKGGFNHFSYIFYFRHILLFSINTVY